MSTPTVGSARGINAWLKMTSTFFSDDDRDKVEWAIGAVLAGGPRKILVISGPPASGKSTVLTLAQRIFTEHWQDKPNLGVSIRHEGVASFADDVFGFAATNDPGVLRAMGRRITSRLIEARTTGRQLSPHEYRMLAPMIDSEHDVIAQYCLETYRHLGKNHYDNTEQENI